MCRKSKNKNCHELTEITDLTRYMLYIINNYE